jgi:chloride channel 7
MAWLGFVGIALAIGLSGSLMTVYYGPGANGSGTAELMALMNGVNYPNILTFPTLITKTFAVVFAVCAGLCVGKEGPLAHIGACMSQLICHIPLSAFDHLKTDSQKRDFIAAGTSAGVSAAFGAPVGGTLFAYEVSKPNTFWRFSLIWKVFITCTFTTFWLGVFD